MSTSQPRTQFLDKGKIVYVDQGIGVVRYVDPQTLTVGIELAYEQDEEIETTDGVLEGKQYFKCRPRCGIFVNIREVLRIIQPEELLREIIKLRKLMGRKQNSFTKLKSELTRIKKENDQLKIIITQQQRQHIINQNQLEPIAITPSITSSKSRGSVHSTPRKKKNLQSKQKVVNDFNFPVKKNYSMTDDNELEIESDGTLEEEEDDDEVPIEEPRMTTHQSDTSIPTSLPSLPPFSRLNSNMTDFDDEKLIQPKHKADNSISEENQLHVDGLGSVRNINITKKQNHKMSLKSINEEELILQNNNNSLYKLNRNKSDFLNNYEHLYDQQHSAHKIEERGRLLSKGLALYAKKKQKIKDELNRQENELRLKREKRKQKRAKQIKDLDNKRLNRGKRDSKKQLINEITTKLNEYNNELTHEEYLQKIKNEHNSSSEDSRINVRRISLSAPHSPKIQPKPLYFESHSHHTNSRKAQRSHRLNQWLQAMDKRLEDLEEKGKWKNIQQLKKLTNDNSFERNNKPRRSFSTPVSPTIKHIKNHIVNEDHSDGSVTGDDEDEHVIQNKTTFRNKFRKNRFVKNVNYNDSDSEEENHGPNKKFQSILDY